MHPDVDECKKIFLERIETLYSDKLKELKIRDAKINPKINDSCLIIFDIEVKDLGRLYNIILEINAKNEMISLPTFDPFEEWLNNRFG